MDIFLADPRFSDMMPGEFPPQGGPIADFSLGDSEEPGFGGGYSSQLDFLGSGMDQRPFPDGPPVGRFGPSGSSDGFGMNGLQEENLSRMYPDYQSHPTNQLMDNTSERPDLREHGSDSSSLPNTLLYYLVLPLPQNKILHLERRFSPFMCFFFKYFRTLSR